MTECLGRLGAWAATITAVGGAISGDANINSLEPVA
jgi:hypothetical protein